MQYANQIGYSDVTPYEVVRVVSEQTLEVREMSSQRDPSYKPEFIPGGFAGHCINQDDQQWVITSDPARRVVRIRRDKRGNWKDKYGNRFSLDAKPVRYYDYNF
jgi:hypothetical protein